MLAKKTYLVHTVYLPKKEGIEKKASKFDYQYFPTKEGVKEFLVKTIENYNLPIDIESVDLDKENNRLGGFIGKNPETGEREYAEHCIVIDNGYKLQDILNNIDSYEFDPRGHNVVGFTKGLEASKKYFKETFTKLVESAKDASESLPDNLFSLENYYGLVHFGRHIKEDEKGYCWDCGGRFNFMLANENTLTVIDHMYRYKFLEKTYGKDFDLREEHRFKIDDIPMCDVDLRIKETGTITHIDVPSGKFIITNHFGKNDDIYDPEDGRIGYESINALSGRIKMAEVLAEKNIAYAQMGNMSINVYVNESGTEIIIGDEYYYDGNQEFIRSFEGFKRIGYISLSVWRWQAADKEILKGFNYPIPENLKEDDIVDHEHMDYALLNIKPGRWKIEHFYDVRGCEDGIYSKLSLVENR